MLLRCLIARIMSTERWFTHERSDVAVANYLLMISEPLVANWARPRIQRPVSQQTISELLTSCQRTGREGLVER